MSKRLFPSSYTLFLLVATLLCSVPGYALGVGDQIEQYPAVLRFLDHSYLANDKTLQWLDHFGPRYYYYHGMSSLARLIPVPALFLLLLLLSNMAVISSAYRLTQLAFPKTRSAPYLAAAFCAFNFFTMAMPGGSNMLTYRELIPSLIALAILLWTTILTWQKRYLLAFCLFSVASLIHPLVSALLGGVAFASASLAELQERKVASDQGRFLDVRPVAALLALVAFTWFLWLKGTHRTLTSAEFIDIVASFRAPHHYLPSHFGNRTILALLLNVAAALLILRQVEREPVVVGIRNRMTWAIVVCLVAFAIGYIFVEIIPSRIVVSAQFYRLTQPVQLIVSIAAAGYFGARIDRSMKPDRRFTWGDSLVLGSTIFAWIIWPLFAIVDILNARFRAWMDTPLTQQRFAFGSIALFVALTFARVGLVHFHAAERFGYFVTFSVICLLFLRLPSSRLVCTAIAVLACLGGLYEGAVRPQLSRVHILGRFIPRPTITPFTCSTRVSDLVAEIRAKTPGDAVIVTPPDEGELRYAAERAIVVDAKALSFQDEAILDWYERMQFLYSPGRVRGNWKTAVAVMNDHYHRISDDTLRQAAAKYTASYAVLFEDTVTSFPVLARGKVCKLVRISL